MRGTVPGLATPFPLLERLPSLFQADELLGRFTGGLDEVLAPVLATLDNLWAYFDPSLCPADFLPYLASWVGVELDDDQPEQVRRHVVASAAVWMRARGTARGLRDQVERLTGGSAEVEDDGGVTWSTTPTEPGPPSDGPPNVHVRVHGVADVDVDRLTTSVRAAVPAHVVLTLEARAPGPASKKRSAR